MFKKFKRSKKPQCYGDMSKLSVKCHECESKSDCLYHINSRISGTIVLPCKLDPHPMPNPQRNANWTLEKAIEDYNKNNPRCENCKFSTTEYEEVLQYVELEYIQCKVKGCKTVNLNAGECKYYTIEHSLEELWNYY